MKICTDLELGDVIMDIKYKFEKKTSGSLMSWGQNSPIPNNFARGPYHSAALSRFLLFATDG